MVSKTEKIENWKVLREFKLPLTPFVIRRPIPSKHVTNIHSQLFQFIFNAIPKMLYLSVTEKWTILILNPDPD